MTQRAISDDGQWWWDGQRWLPALSPDGRWRFDGRAWRRTSTWRQPSPAVLISAAVWVATLALWGPTLVMVLPPVPNVAPDPGVEAVLITVFVVVVVLATAATGFIIGVAAQLRWLWLASVIGAGAQMVGYVASMIIADTQSGGSADDFAAVGLIMLTGPVLLGITALLWAGGGLGALARIASRRLANRSQ
ncbi:hypothetical protein [Sinomonas sp. P47F7]|uniref:hypothetical protein n=1 Tax=Sinomonas sp. P47F7 TaxID=3410987 RepID=UPI003BF5D16D